MIPQLPCQGYQTNRTEGFGQKALGHQTGQHQQKATLAFALISFYRLCTPFVSTQNRCRAVPLPQNNIEINPFRVYPYPIYTSFVSTQGPLGDPANSTPNWSSSSKLIWDPFWGRLWAVLGFDLGSMWVDLGVDSEPSLDSILVSSFVLRLFKGLWGRGKELIT